MIRPRTNGPLSFMRTTTDRSFSRFVTMTCVPKGSVRWAAVMSFMLKTSRLEVGRPWNSCPYQEATPTSTPLFGAYGSLAQAAAPRVRATARTARTRRPPVVPAVEDEDEFLFRDLARLEQGQDLEELVERAESSRKDDHRLGLVGEPEFPHEEIMEGERPFGRSGGG